MRHVSRTHRVALDWLFDRINLDTTQDSNQICRHQTPTSQTYGENEWNNLLHLFNISHFTLLFWSQNFSLTSCTKTMANKMQEQEREEKIVAKSKPTMNLAFTVSTSSSTLQNPIASKKPGDTQGTRKDWSNTKKPEAREFNRDAASSSQGWQKDAVLDANTKRLVATEKDQEHLIFPEDSKNTRKFVASRYSEIESKDKKLPTQSRYIQRRRATHGENLLDRETKIWSQSDRWIERPRCGRTHIGYLYVSHSPCCSSSWHKNYTENLRSTKNQPKNKLWDNCFKWLRSWSLTKLKYCFCNDWLAAAIVERDDSADWQSCSVWNCKNLRLLWLSAVWEVSVLKPVKAWDDKVTWFWETRYFERIGSESSGTIGIRMDIFPSSRHWEFSTRSGRQWFLN